MLNQIKNKQILFIDIETVAQNAEFDEVSEEMQELWAKKSKYFRTQGQSPAAVYERAGIYAEFGKIICISAGFIVKENDKRILRIKSFAASNEKTLLLAFRKLLTKSYNKQNHYLCAHNGKEFDYPYIARRMLINGISLPKILNIAGKKPWEIRHLDTMELWRFGDYKHYTSLNLLTQIFNIPTPKDDIDGSQVGQTYWQENNLERIVRYCEKDVAAVVQLLMRYKGEDLIEQENIIVVE